MEITFEAKFTGLDLNADVPLKCSGCGHETLVKLDKLRPGYVFVCEGCGESTTNDIDYPKVLDARIKDEVAKFNKSLGGR